MSHGAATQVSTLAVIGGGETGLFYVRQLRRALAAGRLQTDRILVVDRDPRCRVAAQLGAPVGLAVADWENWLEEELPLMPPGAHLVPYHWAPHLLVEWLARRVRAAGGQASRGGDVPAQGLPYERPTLDGDRALSYATWACPPACIEPSLCPHTRGPRDWSLMGDLATPNGGDPFDGRIVFGCRHLVYGVGTIAVDVVAAAGRRVVAGLAAGRRRYLVGTASHCHGLATVLEVAPATIANC